VAADELKTKQGMTILSDLQNYLQEYWKHVSQSFGWGKALVTSVLWFVGMFAPLSMRTIVTVPEWAAVAWMASWAALGYLFAPYSMWKAQRRKIEDLQNLVPRS
jgi:hypothetical protein